MTHAGSRLAGLFAAIIVFTFIATVSVEGQVSKVTPRAASALAAAGTGNAVKLWLYFDSARVTSEPIALTERARKRRAKVDPTDLLINEYDYRLDHDLPSEIEATGAVVRYSSRWLKAIAVEADEGEARSLLQLRGLKKIDVVEAYRPMRDLDIEKVSEPGGQSQDFEPAWYGHSLAQMLLTKAWKLHNAGLSGRGVLIAMFDSGFNPHHPIFDSLHIVAAHDFINDRDSVDGPDCPSGPEQYQQDYHGTATLSVIGGFIPTVIIGVAHGADFALAKTEVTCGGLEIKAEEYNWIAASEWADSLGADIISASLGYTVFQDSGSYSQAELDGQTALITRAAEIAASKNILVVNAAGNERTKPWGTIVFPADGDSVLAVGAVSGSRWVSSFSSPGPTADGRIKPDIVSLGVNVYAARSAGITYMLVSGTSISTPIVAGGAALAMEYDSTLTAMELLQLIRQTGDRATKPDNDYGYGLYDASRSADIAHVDSVEGLRVALDETIVIPVTTSGRSPEPPSISAPSPPAGVVLEDNGNGTGYLRITGRAQNLGTTKFPLMASVPDFAETTYVVMATYESLSEAVQIGPNPFTDSVRIFVYASGGSSVSVSIFNSAGEKVWERLNISGSASDVITWDGRNNAGREVAPGVYLVLVNTDRIEKRLKLLKIK